MTQTRILVIDDSDADFQLLLAHLRRRNRSLHTLRVDNARALEAALRDSDWDAVVSDHSMPGFSSHEALSIVARLTPHIPVIVYSGDLDEETGLSTFQRGATDFVPKGKYQRLLNAIDREMGIAALKAEKVRAEQLALKAGLHDESTSLPTRAHFLLHAEALVGAAIAAAQPALLLCLKIDRYEQIRESFGSGFITHLAQSLAKHLQVGAQHARVYRFADDQFGLWIDRLDTEQSPQEWVKALEARTACGLTVEGQRLYPTFSIGVALCPQHTVHAPQLIAYAEEALQLAIKQGGNRCRIHEPDVVADPSAVDEATIKLQEAIAQGRLRLDLLPWFDGPQQHVMGMSGRLQFADANEVWHDAEELVNDSATELCAALDSCLLRQAFQQISSWRRVGEPQLRLRIDLHAPSIDPQRLRGLLQRSFAACPAGLSQLELGLSAAWVQEDSSRAQELIAALKDLPVEIGLIGFGEGSWALETLALLKADSLVIKLDPNSPHLSAVLELSLVIAAHCNARLIYAGLESSEEAKTFFALQGRYWALRNVLPPTCLAPNKANDSTPILDPIIDPACTLEEQTVHETLPAAA